MLGKIITFEGLDASFKETNSNRLAERLKDNGYDVHIFHLPQYNNPSCYFVEEFLAGNYKHTGIDIEPIAKSVFYALDRFDLYSKKIMPILENATDKTVIVLDRWTASNIFYQTAMYEDSYNFQIKFGNIYSLEHDIFKLPIENGIIFMDTPYNTAIKVLGERSKKDYIESNSKWMKKVFDNIDRVLENYLLKSNMIFKDKQEAFQYYKVSTVDSDGELLSKDQIFEKVYIAALKILGGNKNV